MLNFFKNRFGKVEAIRETQRETATRALSELNEILAGLDVKPKLSFDPATGAVELELPDQMPDEALALPAPEVETEKAPAEDKEQLPAAA